MSITLLTRRGYSEGMMKAHVFIISMLTGIVVTYAVLLLGCAFTGKTQPPYWRCHCVTYCGGFCSSTLEEINVT